MSNRSDATPATDHTHNTDRAYAAHANIVREGGPASGDHQLTIACYGDSFTGGVQFSPTQTYPGYLQELFGGWARVIDLGVGGSTTVTLLSSYATRVATRAPDIVIFGAGYNDLCADNRPYADIIANLATMYTTITASGAQPMAWTIPPFGQSSCWNASFETTRLAVNKWIREASGVVWSDVDMVIGDHSIADQPRKRAAYVHTDNVHFSPQGAQALAQVLANDLFQGGPRNVLSPYAKI